MNWINFRPKRKQQRRTQERHKDNYPVYTDSFTTSIWDWAERPDAELREVAKMYERKHRRKKEIMAELGIL